MSKFKIGDKVTFVNDYGLNPVNLTLGNVYTVYTVSGEFVTLTDGEFTEGCYDYRLELYEEKEPEMALTSTMTAEQIRNEILRIKTRIEEAKKDIESAEKERNSLVEKLREKGFELLYSGSVSNIEKRPTEGDKVRVIRVDHDYPKTIYLGYEFVIQRDDHSPLPYMDEYHNWFREDSVVKI